MRSYMPILSGLSMIGAGVATYCGAPILLPAALGAVSSLFTIDYVRSMFKTEAAEIQEEREHNHRSRNQAIKNSDELNQMLDDRVASNSRALYFSIAGNLLTMCAQMANAVSVGYAITSTDQSMTTYNVTLPNNQTAEAILVTDILQPNTALSKTLGLLAAGNAVSSIITYCFSERLESVKSKYKSEKSKIQAIP